MNKLSLHHLGARHAARGFTLVELMIALLIGLFLTGGLLTLMFAMRRSTTTQAGLSQLQDDERMGMSILTSAIQSAGYYPTPYPTNNCIHVFPGGLTAGGRPVDIRHAHESATTPDTLIVRYATAGTATAGIKDNTINCAGQTSTTQKSWTQTFQIDTTNKVLQCILHDGGTRMSH